MRDYLSLGIPLFSHKFFFISCKITRAFFNFSVFFIFFSSLFFSHIARLYFTAITGVKGTRINGETVLEVKPNGSLNIKKNIEKNALNRVKNIFSIIGLTCRSVARS